MSQARRVDLHMHSSRSDGRYPPQEVLERAAAARLDVVAITDHDLVGALQPGPHHVNGHTVHLLAAAEMSGVHEGREFHLLVYFPDVVPEEFVAFCRDRTAARAERYDRAVHSLGVPELEAASTDAHAGQASLTRHHLARELVSLGHARNMRDAFRRFVGYRHEHVSPVDLTFIEAIRVAKKAGAVTSWAHPPFRAVMKYVETFAEAGLDGLEVLRPRLKRGEARQLTRICERYGLLRTGGSDWHGWHDAPLGLYFVEEPRMAEFFERLGLTA